MKVDAEHIRTFKQALKKDALRLTPQRLAILEDVLAHEEHRECDDIYTSLKAKGTRVSRATIYRTLDLLEQVGFVRKMDIGDGRFRYERQLAEDHHDHMICTSCGRIVEFVDPEIERRQDRIAVKNGFRLDEHSHQLFGLCPACQDREASQRHNAPTSS